MADIKLFNINGRIEELPSGNVTLEKDLQTVIESNMPNFFGVTFLATEYITNNGGRMDSIGIDENYCPVIFEYKRSQNENVINQGLFYLDWLLSHKDSFKVLVIEKLGLEVAAKIDWTMPRVICVAGDFNKYDESAINQMNRNISLIRYKKFGENLLMLEQLNQNVVKPLEDVEVSLDNSVYSKKEIKSKKEYKSFDDYFAQAGKERQQLYNEIRDYILSLGDDITESKLKLYVAFKKIKNFVCAQVYHIDITLNLKLDPVTVKLEEGFSRDVTSIGHWATGNLELHIKTKEDFEKAKPLIERAYKEN